MLIRMQFRKTAEGRFLSHLDLIHTWERVFRRTNLPLGFSQGFNPHPKINFASASAVGMSSDGEYMDFELTKDVPMAHIQEAFARALPPAFAIVDMKQIPPKSPSLMSSVQRAAYRLLLEYIQPVDLQAVEASIQAFWVREEAIIYRYKKNSKDKKPVNIRPLVEEITVEGDQNEKRLWMEVFVHSGDNGNVRPEEVPYALMESGMPYLQHVVRIHRKGLYALNEQGEAITLLDAVAGV